MASDYQSVTQFQEFEKTQLNYSSDCVSDLCILVLKAMALFTL